LVVGRQLEFEQILLGQAYFDKISNYFN